MNANRKKKEKEKVCIICIGASAKVKFGIDSIKFGTRSEQQALKELTVLG